MEFKGADFIKKVQRQKEVEELRRRLEELEQLNDAPSSNKSSKTTNYSQVDDDEVESFEKTFYQTSYEATNHNDEIQDIAITKPLTKQSTLPIDKKKFAILGFFLVIVFVFTVIVIRFFMNYASTQNDLLEQNAPAVDEKAIEQKFEKIVTQAKEMNVSDANVSSNKETNVTVPATVEHPSLTPMPTAQQAPQTTPPQTQASQQQTPKPVVATPIATQNVQTNNKPTTQPQSTQEQNKKTLEKEKVTIVQKETKAKPVVVEQTIQKKKEETKTTPVAPKRDMQELFGLKKEQKTQAQKPADTTVQAKNKEAVLKEELKNKKVEQKVTEKPTLASVKPLPPYKPTNKSVTSQQNVSPKTETKQENNSPQPQNTSAISNTKRYIQAGSFYTYAPSPDYISKLNASGYPYKIQRSQTASGTTLDRVLIGPFSEDEAKANLSKIKQVVTPGAFIIK